MTSPEPLAVVVGRSAVAVVPAGLPVDLVRRALASPDPAAAIVDAVLSTPGATGPLAYAGRELDGVRVLCRGQLVALVHAAGHPDTVVDGAAGSATAAGLVVAGDELEVRVPAGPMVAAVRLDQLVPLAEASQIGSPRRTHDLPLPPPLPEPRPFAPPGADTLRDLQPAFADDWAPPPLVPLADPELGDLFDDGPSSSDLAFPAAAGGHTMALGPTGAALPPAPELPGLPAFPEPAAPPPAAPPAGHLRFSTGLVTDLDRPVLVGRRPTVDADWSGPVPALVALDDPEGHLSRVHAELRSTPHGAVVVDRGSTNGTTVERPGARPVELVPGEPYALEDGDRIVLGGEVSCTFDARSRSTTQEVR
jgi:hypothetical protein